MVKMWQAIVNWGPGVYDKVATAGSFKELLEKVSADLPPETIKGIEADDQAFIDLYYADLGEPLG